MGIFSVLMFLIVLRGKHFSMGRVTKNDRCLIKKIKTENNMT